MGETILIVDDNAANLKLARVTLMGEGYDVHTAVDAEEAMELLQRLHPKLILTDLQLPGMDGLELTRALKRDPQRSHIVIVALTAYAMKGDDAKALDAGCDGYITKPIDLDAFIKAVAGYLASARPG